MAPSFWNSTGCVGLGQVHGVPGQASCVCFLGTCRPVPGQVSGGLFLGPRRHVPVFALPLEHVSGQVS